MSKLSAEQLDIIARVDAPTNPIVAQLLAHIKSSSVGGEEIARLTQERDNAYQSLNSLGRLAGEWKDRALAAVGGEGRNEAVESALRFYANEWADDSDHPGLNAIPGESYSVWTERLTSNRPLPSSAVYPPIRHGWKRQS